MNRESKIKFILEDAKKYGADTEKLQKELEEFEDKLIDRIYKYAKEA